MWIKLLQNPLYLIYKVELDFNDIQDPDERDYFNGIPTSFVIEKEQVDHLIELAGKLLRKNPNYQRLLSDLDNR